MLIINKYITTTPVGAAVVATNDGNAVTGNQSAKWAGINPNVATGATGNAVAGNGLIYVDTTTTEIKDEVISKLVQVQCTGVFTAGQDNFIKIPLSNVGISGTKVIKGIQFLGVFDPNAVNDGLVPTPSVINIVPGTAASVSIVKDIITIKVFSASIALFQNKYINVLLYYSHY